MRGIENPGGVLFSVVFLSVTLTMGACAVPDEPVLYSQGRPIVYGQPDDNPAHMATVALTFGPGTQFFCSGSLISERVVLTAAHCLEGGSASSLQIFFGNNVHGQGEYRAVQETLIHPSYDRDSIVNDIGLIRLSGPAPAGITPIPHLPAQLGLNQADEGSTSVDFSGFGQTETNSSGVKLHVSDVIEVVCDGPGSCQGYVNPLTMGYDQDPGGPCSGDSGGPAYVLRDGVEYVAGVTSYGDQNCAQFGASTMADRFAPWIESFITPEDCENGSDDDGDGLVDCADSECAGHATCPDACQLAVTVSCGQVKSGTTAGGTWEFNQYSCLQDGVEAGSEVAFLLDVPAGTPVTADLFPGSGGDLDFFALQTTSGACDLNRCLGGSFEYNSPERIEFEMPAEAVYLVVDTWDNPTTFDLEISCGDTEICDNGQDDDGDGQVDCADDDCAQAASCQPAHEICDNELDDDQDGLVDCADDDCAQDQACQPVDEICANGLDDDGDGQVDCADDDCAQDQACQPVDEICTNGLDDDGDGQMDCADEDCADDPSCQPVPEDCENGLDDDGDFAIDCADTDCAANPACQTPDEDCANGLDDDGDGLSDCADSDCSLSTICQDEDNSNKPGGCAHLGGSSSPAGLMLLALGLLLVARRKR